MKQAISIVLLPMAALLAACASPPLAPPPVSATATIDQQILDAAAKVDAAQVALFRAAAINRERGDLVIASIDTTHPISLTWHGDANPLLLRLAAGRGLVFQPMGARMPLPIALDVSDENFDSVLDRVRSQVGYRATIDVSNHVLTLQYNRPKS
ncbi:DotD/TraH family lipoprotein [Rugamonas apoptosis]|uniref:DotD/TraH family lipoprotein n=1 Tax=Rugamonas apoptosis TaxID=2758570 RepID=A0A7W2IK63_9BURK|nr:DotD/TraH family lipoprotein [Rugamonas apoptosis]MBA5687229.1 DotD/TraH family lipoprotein [Rugamonas apoptosis]